MNNIVYGVSCVSILKKQNRDLFLELDGTSTDQKQYTNTRKHLNIVFIYCWRSSILVLYIVSINVMQQN